MKAVGCIATLCLLVTYLGTCQGTTTTAVPAVTTPSTAAPGAVTTAAGGVTTAAPAGGVTTAAPGAQTTAPPVDIGGNCPSGTTCATGLICDTTCKIAATHDCAGHTANCQNGTSCVAVSTVSTCTVKDGFVGSTCANSTVCTAANSECSSGSCQCKSGYNKVTATLECKSGSATVMASVLVLAVAFVKTQLF